MRLFSAAKLSQCLGDSVEVVQHHKDKSHSQNQNPHRRSLHHDNAQQEQGGGVGGEFGVVDRKRNILPCVHDPDTVADKVAGECGNCRTHDAPDVNEDNVQHDVHDCSHQTGPERVCGVLGRRVNTAQELVEAHHQHAYDQYRRIEERGGVFRIGVGIDQNVGQDPDKYDQSGTGDKHERLVGIEYTVIEPASVLGVVFLNGGHVPRLKENRGNGGDQVRDLGGNTVDTGGSFAHQSCRTGPRKTGGGKKPVPSHSRADGISGMENRSIMRKIFLSMYRSRKYRCSPATAHRNSPDSRSDKITEIRKPVTPRWNPAIKVTLNRNRVSVASMPSMANNRTNPRARTNWEAICRNPEVIQ